jgi:ribonuclease P protein component
MPNKQKKNTTLINNCIEISLNDSAGPFSSIKISIPKKIVKSAVQRNRIKQIYRINFQKGLNKNFLVKFKREDCVFKQELEEFFLNV